MEDVVLGLSWLAAFVVLALVARRWGVDTRDGFTQLPKQVLR